MRLIAELLTKLSPRTLHNRFLSPLPGMYLERAWQEVNRLWNNKDSLEIALIATVKEFNTERAIAIAELARTTEQPGNLELGIVVRDDYQNQGIGSALLRRLLMYAEACDFTNLLVYLSMENKVMHQLVQKLERPYTTRYWQGTTLLTLRLNTGEQKLNVA